jgi:predicted MFS family arabinose efflux permease
LELLEGEDNTQAVAGYMALSSAVSIFGPFAGGWLIERVGYAGNFLVSGGVRLAAALLFLAILKPSRHTRITADHVPTEV